MGRDPESLAEGISVALITTQAVWSSRFPPTWLTSILAPRAISICKRLIDCAKESLIVLAPKDWKAGTARRKFAAQHSVCARLLKKGSDPLETSL